MAMATPAPVSSPWNEAVEKVVDAPMEKAWAIASDFLGFPSQHIDKVEKVKGENGLPGCQRKLLYKNQKGGQNFVVEELVAVDAANHKVSYTLVSTDEIVEPGQEAYIQVSDTSFSSSVCRLSVREVRSILIVTSNREDLYLFAVIFSIKP